MGDLESIFNDDWPDHHRSGVVSIVGRPNVGKSTLVNKILGQKIAIVTDTPQTTRRQQLGIYTTEDVQILFTDTPGIHDPHHKLGEYMNRVARAALRDADAILWVVDASANPTKEDQSISEMLARTGKTPVIVALNKIDLIAEDRREVQFAPYHALLASDRVTFLPVSAAEGTHIDRLMDQLVELLPLGPRYYPKEQVSEVNLRYMAAEVVREKIILNTYEEIPHAVAVEIDIFEEKPNDTYEIHATIYVEKSSQKGIIIGSKGTMIKQIGTQARQELETMFAHHVQLFLHVKVLKNWRSEDRLMRRFGYSASSDES